MKTLITFLISCFLLSSGVLAADIDGTWKGAVPGPDGNPMDITYEFESSYEDFTGTVSTGKGEGPISGGKVEGNNISFFVNIPGTIVYVSGTLSGGVINMTQKKGDKVNKFTLRRVTQEKTGESNNSPIIKQEPQHKEIKVPPEILVQYAGIYKMSPESDATVTVRGDRIFCQITGMPNLRLFPESKTKYSFRVEDWSIEFFNNDKDTATYAVYHRNGNNVRIKKQK